MTISKDIKFEAAHMLSYYEGACSNLHGHSYKGSVQVQGVQGKVTHMVLDYNIVKEVITKWDHALIVSDVDLRDEAEEALLQWALKYNKKVVFMPEGRKCTAEDMAWTIKEQLEQIAGPDYRISVMLKETSSSVAIAGA